MYVGRVHMHVCVVQPWELRTAVGNTVKTIATAVGNTVKTIALFQVFDGKKMAVRGFPSRYFRNLHHC